MVRFKQRYLLVQVNFDGKPTQQYSNKDVYSAVSGTMNRVFGVWGYGCCKASLMIKYWNSDTGMLIVRVARDHVRVGWTTINCVQEVAGRKCSMRVVHTGGTIKLVKRRLLKIHNMDTKAALSK